MTENEAIMKIKESLGEEARRFEKPETPGGGGGGGGPSSVSLNNPGGVPPGQEYAFMQ